MKSIFEMLASNGMKLLAIVLLCANVLMFSLTYDIYWPERNFTAPQQQTSRTAAEPIDLLQFLSYLDEQLSHPSSELFLVDAALLGCMFQRGAPLCTDFSVVSVAMYWDGFALIPEHLSLPIGWNITKNLHYILFTFKSHTVVLYALYDQKYFWYLAPISHELLNLPAKAMLKHSMEIYQTSTPGILIPKKLDFFLWDNQHTRFLDCNSALVSVIKDKFPKEISAKPKVSDSNFDDVLYVRDLLYTHHIPAMLWSGSLLGWYRHCGIGDMVPHAQDVDFVIPNHTFYHISAKFENVLACDSRIKLEHKIGQRADSLKFGLNANGLKIDLYVFYKNSTTSWVNLLNVIDEDTKQKLRQLYPIVGEICRVSVREHLFHVPCNVEKVLLAEYGPTWLTPNQQYKWHQNQRNVERAGIWNARKYEEFYRTTFKCDVTG